MRQIHRATPREIMRYGAPRRRSLPPIAGGAGPVVDNWLGATPSGTSLTSAAAVRGGELVLLFETGSGTARPTLGDSVGNSYVEQSFVTLVGGSGQQRIVTSMLVNPLTTSSTFTSSPAGMLGAVSFAGAWSTQYASASAQATASITANAGDLVVGVFTALSSGHFAAGPGLAAGASPGWTLIATGSSGGPGWTVAYIVPTSTGTVTFQAVSTTNTSDRHTVLAFKASHSGLTSLM